MVTCLLFSKYQICVSRPMGFDWVRVQQKFVRRFVRRQQSHSLGTFITVQFNHHSVNFVSVRAPARRQEVCGKIAAVWSNAERERERNKRGRSVRKIRSREGQLSALSHTQTHTHTWRRSDAAVEIYTDYYYSRFIPRARHADYDRQTVCGSTASLCGQEDLDLKVCGGEKKLKRYVFVFLSLARSLSLSSPVPLLFQTETASHPVATVWLLLRSSRFVVPTTQGGMVVVNAHCKCRRWFAAKTVSPPPPAPASKHASCMHAGKADCWRCLRSLLWSLSECSNVDVAAWNVTLISTTTLKGNLIKIYQ